jgi:hypothetical protein
MLQAYVDASGKGDLSRLVVAGYVADSEDWAKFSIDWKKRLDCAGLPYFKMNEMKRKPEIAGWFYRLIEEHSVKAAIAVVVNTTELVEVEKSIKYPTYIVNPNSALNPYYWAVKFIAGSHRYFTRVDPDERSLGSPHRFISFLKSAPLENRHKSQDNCGDSQNRCE